MDLLNIVSEYLKKNGYDGLYIAGRCACKIDDLMPCEEPSCNCEAGFLVPEDSEEFEIEFDFMIGPNKHEH